MSTPLSMSEGSPAAPASQALARVEGLTVTFPDTEQPAVHRVSLTIHAGECVALVGESGSGKTLTARSLLGLLPATARVQGQVWLRPPILAHGSPAELRPAPPLGSREWNGIRGAGTALVPQDALGALDPLRRIELEVGDSLRLHGRAAGAERRRRVIAALGNAGIPEPEARLRQRSDELSGGLRQRVLVAAALIAEPALIVADEPTTALDAEHRGRVLEDLRRRVDSGAGVLLISHDLASVRGVADRVLVMRDGLVVEEGEASRVLTAPAHSFTRELLAANPAGKPRGSRLLGSTAELREPRSESRTASAHRPRPTALKAPRLELSGIDVTFGQGDQARPVLADASLRVHHGETVGLIGESGSGKTTLLRVALGLQGPDAGQVLIDGADRALVDRATRKELRRRIAFVPQDPLDSFPTGASGRGLLTDALRAAGIARGLRAARAAALATEVGLTAAELLRPAATLSGGQRQRLAIARALALGSEILLLDEPVSALDVSVQARVLDLLDDLQGRHGTAYLFVSHDEDVVRHMSDRVLRLAGGRILEAG